MFVSIQIESNLSNFLYQDVTYGDDILEAIASVSGGDLRKAITFLQSLHTSVGETVTPKSVYDLAGVIPQVCVFALFLICSSITP